ncbi:MAG: hypothetical protein U0165_20335 [Polyangiaceae bacterium]
MLTSVGVKRFAGTALGAVLTFAPARVFAGESDIPSWAVALGAGFTVRGEPTTQPSGEVKRELVLHGAAGGTAAYRLHLGPTVLFAEGLALPVWSNAYGGRGGVLIGWQGSKAYTELMSSRQEGTTVTNTYGESTDRVKWVAGFQAGGGYYHSPRGDTPIVEVGVGSIGQNTLDLLAVYDPKRAAWGARIDLLRFTRSSWVTVLWGVQLQTLLQDLKQQPMPVILNFAIGIAQPFSFK